ncbi:MAG: glutamate-5-semialdehyde dehydrogenase [Bacteroidales bacterium]|nr:glutamate-5-semialdehyde dehydrogenase [Bacteroidales bacterium]
MEIIDLAISAKKASLQLAALDSDTKNQALQAIIQNLRKYSAEIIGKNEIDFELSEKKELALPLLKRLKFDVKKIEEVIAGIKSLITIPDPVGETLSALELDEGMELYKVSCPIGVIGIVFESRPDALIQISTLCLKSGNAVILKGGSEAQHTNRMLTTLIIEATKKVGIPDGWIQLLETRADVDEMLKMDEYIDLIIPRGSNKFVKYIMDNSNIPVLGHADGICHVYIDEDINIEMAVNIAIDSKVQYVAVCNAADTILIHENIAQKILPILKNELDKYNVEIFGCSKTYRIINSKLASDENWKTEYLDYKVSIKIVENLEEAIDHINTYGSGHTDSIVTNNKEKAGKFMDMVDSANVLWNCSTRFSDGYRYGLGAEVGVSTNKIHARGPVGLEGLLIYKWKLIGNGQTVSEYSEGDKTFLHRQLNKKFK